MDVDSRPPVTSQQPSFPPLPHDIAPPPLQEPTPVATAPSPPIQDNVTVPSQPAQILDPPRHAAPQEADSQKSPEENVLPSPLPASPFSLNLISAFKLDSLAATVARFDPHSGEKINKMRKSYENYLKKLDLLGKNRAVKHEEAVTATGGQSMMSLTEVAAWPEEEWQMQRVQGKDLKKGLSEATKAKLERALTMNPGPVKDQAKWDDILGVDRANPSASGSKSRKEGNAAINGKPVATANAPSAGSAAPSGDHIRARRNTKKRRYDDGSFEGYGEGFVDDELDNEGYESGETYTSRNSRGSKGDRKRRKTQDNSAGGGPGPPSRNGSFVSGYGR